MGNAFLHGNGGGSRLNFSVKAYASVDDLPEKARENTIAVFTDTPITDYAVGVRNPYYDYHTINVLDNVTLGEGLLKSDGTITELETDMPKYTQDYVSVKYGVAYQLNYKASEIRSEPLTIFEYKIDSNTGEYTYVKTKTFSGYTKRLAAEYTPSDANITAIRLTWNTYGDEAFVTLIGVDIPYPKEEIKDGMLWVRTSLYSPVSLNLLKKHMLQAYPVFFQQYISGAWINKDAAVYIENKWVDFATYLYLNGNENVDFTGGWTAKALRSTSVEGSMGSVSVQPKITKGFNCLHATMPYISGAGPAGVIHCTNKIDVTKFNKLCFYGVMCAGVSSTSIQIALWSDWGYEQNTNCAVAYVGDVTQFASLDISNLSGEYYIGIGLSGWVTFVNIESMWLEK
jgi:hypothetical protein